MELSDSDKVSIVAGINLLGLVVVLKNVLHVQACFTCSSMFYMFKHVLHVQADILSRDIIVYIIIYWAFTFSSLPSKEKPKKSKYDSPFYWSLLIILITIAIIAIYAMNY